MQNRVKSATNDCIRELQEAAIDTIMATGDNGLTAVSVGRECGIMNPNKVAYLAELVVNEREEKSVKWSKIEVPKSDLDKKASQALAINDDSEQESIEVPNKERKKIKDKKKDKRNEDNGKITTIIFDLISVDITILIIKQIFSLFKISFMLFKIIYAAAIFID